MTATLAGVSAYQSGISIGAILNGVVSGASAISAELSNAFLSGSGSYPAFADLVITSATSITTGAGSPNLQVVLLPKVDGSNYENTYVSSSQLFPYNNVQFGQQNLAPSSAYLGSGNMIRVSIGWTAAALFKAVVLWNGGVNLPATVAASFYPYGWSGG